MLCPWVWLIYIDYLAQDRTISIADPLELPQSYTKFSIWYACTVYPKKYAHSFCFVVVIHWLIFPYPSGLLHWHCGNLTIAPVPAKQHWWIWINTSCEFIMNDCITTTKQSTTKPCAYFLGYTVFPYVVWHSNDLTHLPWVPHICVGKLGQHWFR